jgi:PAS domain S-box-containing protein
MPFGPRCIVFYRDLNPHVGNPERLAFFYRNFLNTPSAICITDEEGCIMEANQAFLDLYGYTQEEIIGKNPRILKSGRQTPATYMEMWRKLTDPSQEKWSGELINRRKNGEEITVHLTISAVHNFANQHMGFIATAVDMTTYKNIERYLEDCNRKLVETNQLKSDMMAITSHDLKSPLNAIISRACMLRDMATEISPAKQLEQVEKIIASGVKMGEFIDELLDLEKMEAGRLQLETSRIHLDSLLYTCVETSMPVATAKGIQLKVLIQGEREPIYADLIKLEQVFNNIISNAIKYTPRDGRVTVTCHGTHGSEKLITIADTGPGIPETLLSQIFDRFFQVKHDGRAPGRVYGAGLGLSIAKNIVELHGGDVAAANRPEGGCEFTIRLPAKGRVCSGQDIAALIIDPNHEIYTFIEPHLTQRGVSCYIAGNLSESIRFCRREHPELIFAAIPSLGDGLQNFLHTYAADVCKVAVGGEVDKAKGVFSAFLTIPATEADIFKLIDELLPTGGTEGK